jgi:Zn-finger nucleic acid-binding protein
MTEKPSRNEDEYFVRQEAELMRQRRAELRNQEAEAERLTHYMKCPKDGHDLVSQGVHGVTVDICPHCGGMWLDPGELDVISKHDDRRGLLGRVFGDVMRSLRPGHRDDAAPSQGGGSLG